MVVNPSWTLQECTDEANANASERYFQLEQKGMFSIQTIERVFIIYYFLCPILLPTNTNTNTNTNINIVLVLVVF